MKTIKLLLVLLIASAANAQCYSKIVSYSRNYIALQTDGTLWSKGHGYNPILGFGNTNAVAEFTQIGTDNNWTDKIVLNGQDVFAIRTDGTLWVWGVNLSNGYTGLGSFEYYGPFGPTQVGTDADWANVATGSGFTLAVKTDGTLWAWGINDKGQLGIGNADDLYKTNVPIQVGTETDWKNVFLGQLSCAYAIKTNGSLWSWGNNGNYIGYSGSELNNSYRTPHQVGTDPWLSITVGILTPIAYGIKVDCSLWAWGTSNFDMYAFGNGIDIYSSQTPLRIGTDSDWKEICFGQSTTLALKTNGTRWGWGRNGNGHELGMGASSTSNVTVPTQLDADIDWNHIGIDLYEGYGCGIKQNSSLYYWGNTHTNVVYPSPTLFSPTTCILGTKEFDLTDDISVFPNPAKDNITVRLNLPASHVEFVITNSLGQVLTSGQTEIINQEIILNVGSFSNGIYCLTINYNGDTYTEKIIKN